MRSDVEMDSRVTLYQLRRWLSEVRRAGQPPRVTRAHRRTRPLGAPPTRPVPPPAVVAPIRRADIGRPGVPIARRSAPTVARRCLRCDRPFQSTGPGNRLCETHR